MAEVVDSTPAPVSVQPSVMAALHGHGKAIERAIMHLVTHAKKRSAVIVETGFHIWSVQRSDQGLFSE